MKLRVIPTKAHAAVDAATGPALIAAPTLLRMNGNGGATIPPRVFGSAATLYSLLTDYELGVKRVVPLRAHLALDALGGVALAATPWLTGARRQGLRHWLPHAIVGGNELALALLTREERPRFRRGQELVRRVPPRALAAFGAAAVAIGALVAWRQARLSAGEPSAEPQDV